jgi:integrase
MARVRAVTSTAQKYAGRKSENRPKRYVGLYIDVDGIERSAGSFDRRTDAMAEAVAYENEANKGKRRDPKSAKQTFQTFARSVMDSKRHLREGTRKRDESHLRNHLFPLFGSVQLRHITEDLAHARINRLTDERGLSARTAKECRRIAWGIM